MDDKFFRELNEEETQDFITWTQEMFVPGEEPNPLWHPVVRKEWARLQARHDSTTTDETWLDEIS